ncbi:MAG: 4-hydroxy-3-methylbut-2-enyl diphosphate reductase [Bacteroidales bacterium]|nr:4-hydroxy-3-methylbut-2-enyl diphosphate reductase [Bacteroidales bacterium]
MKIEIDKNSGFCFGVIKAISKAEELLEKNKSLYCLGEIVHNSMEVERLKNKGLKIIDHNEFENLKNLMILIRAHGEPPITYQKAKENNIELIDATCPVVLKLQKNIKDTYLKALNENAQIVIFGREGHPEVIGLVGQTNNTAIVINNIIDLKKIDFNRPIYLFAQTTKDPDEYKQIIEIISKETAKNNVFFKYKNSICKEVIKRKKTLVNFARSYDLIIFVSSKHSSNGKSLFKLCKKNNNRTYFITDEKKIKIEWFKNVKSIGITGATSTPLWLMEKIKNYISNLCINV